MRITKALWMIVVSFLVVSSCSNEENKINIYSIPDNLNIYFARIDTNTTNLGELGKWVKIYNKTSNQHYLVTKENYKGKSPVVMNDLEPGHYLVAVEPVEFYDPKTMRTQNIDPFLKPVAMVSSFPFEDQEMVNKFRAGEIQLEGAMIYHFEKVKDQKGMILLHCKEDIPLDELKNYYPVEPDFKYDGAKLIKELEENNFHTLFTEDEIQTTLTLLSRGGVAAVRKGDIKFLIQILSEDKFRIEVVGKIPD